ncbi:MAG: LysM peptidoglycan-binding domain-containing protein [Synergistota bacterium]|nr:LysM peptidoglycan-binding domain-containing protein [Synergistota bacterium]
MKRLVAPAAVILLFLASAMLASDGGAAFNVHSVRAGDTLESVARLYGADAANIAAANGISAGDLPPPGTVVLVPKSPGDVLATLYEAKRRGLGAWPKPRMEDSFLAPLTGQPAADVREPPAPPPPAPGDGHVVRSHTVREGDNPYRISREYGVSLTALLRANNLTEGSVIRIGDVLTIPARSEPGPPADLAPAEVRKPSAPEPPGADQSPAEPPARQVRPRLTWPLKGGAPPVMSDTSFGEGLISRATPGDRVGAAADGTVLHGGWMRNFGNAVFINHGEGLATFYGGLGTIYVKSGDRVRSGDRIGLVGPAEGDSARFVFHVLKEGKSVDPAPWLGTKKE